MPEDVFVAKIGEPEPEPEVSEITPPIPIKPRVAPQLPPASIRLNNIGVNPGQAQGRAAGYRRG